MKLEDSKKIPIEFNLANSPLAQAPLWSPLPAYNWQRAVWLACWRVGARVAVRTANGSGKSSFTVPILALSFAAAFPGAQVVITSFSEDQISQQLWPALRSMAMNREGWRHSKEMITAPSVDGLPGSTIILRVTRQGERFEGYHERWFTDDQRRSRYAPLMIIADEDKSIKPEIHTAIDRCAPTVELRISTCGDDSGGFYDACMNKDGTWITGCELDGTWYEFKIDWKQCPHLFHGDKAARFHAMIATLGSNHPKVRSILKAEFMRGGSHMLFDDIDLDLARQAMTGLVPKFGRTRTAFCDFSGGGDELTFGVRDGNMVHPIVAWHRTGNTPPSVEAAKYIRLFEQWGLSSNQIAGDNGGLGALIISELEKRGWNIQRINPNVAPIAKAQYVDRYTEMHWEYKKALHEGMLILPDDPVLLEQMQRRRYVMKNTEDNKIRVEPKETAKKERQEKSPDRLDTIVHLCRNLEPLPVLHENSTAPRCGTPNEYWKDLEDAQDTCTGDVFGGGWSGI